MQDALADELSIPIRYAVSNWSSVRELVRNSSSRVDYWSISSRRDANEVIHLLVASPVSLIDGWSQPSALTPPPSNDWHGRNLNVKQDPRWNPETVRKYVRSFKDNVLSLYPLIVPAELDIMVAEFLYERFYIDIYSRVIPPLEA
ncbi:uncharacterized protein F4822DRAFT_435290 [Hypoxylon trugodes]|uniref:uncharacterized protein n=1 Tax=Hypoxylon trugodes TaxID=326681 RepID=UPI0021961297|nr:uncharacterized protein F4822DRAFT_435290 [Hypoxylon trugodes]KAI1382614.1 hypothetical protein F4822DRAFT_435290 [Hypoxylon trugodes]